MNRDSLLGGFIADCYTGSMPHSPPTRSRIGNRKETERSKGRERRKGDREGNGNGRW